MSTPSENPDWQTDELIPARGLASMPRLVPQEIHFERTEGGLVRAVLATAHVEPVGFSRAFPFTAPDDLIPVRDGEGKEIGILAHIEVFARTKVHLVREELQRHYFAPRITVIRQLDERFGQSLWHVDTEAGQTELLEQNEHVSLVDLPDSSRFLFDVHGNHYRLAPRAELEPRIRRKLEFMY